MKPEGTELASLSAARGLAGTERSEVVMECLQGFLAAASRDQCVTAVHSIEARPPVHGEWPAALSGRLVDAMRQRGVERLYCHQSEAIGHALAGRHVVVVTPTASGKTLCYNLPVLQALLDDPSARALYIFPTKALAQDQLAELQATVDAVGEPVAAFTFDGDTPGDARRAVRSRAQVVVTNPDMLHAGLLPHHPRFARLFQNLRYVVIDELHTYRGVFGSHVCNVIRRLKRVARLHGSRPVFIMSSATIANPRQLAEKLIESPVELVERNGAPQAAKDLVFYNPPMINVELGIRRSCINQARWIASRFLKHGIQTIAFATSRQNVEVLTRYLKEDVERPPHRHGHIRAYRGGYLPNTRREIERGLRNGEILGVVSTNALELGVDIGHLDVAVMAGYPGSVASTWQQAGRAGRRAGHSVAILVARSEPLDQFMVTHPEYFLGCSPELGLINADNLLILLGHVKCAAFECPFTDDERFGDQELRPILEYLGEEGILTRSGDRWHFASDAYPADDVSLRTVSPEENFVIMLESDHTRTIAEVDFHSAPTTVYKHAIYMLETESYEVIRLDYDLRKVFVEKKDVDYYTDAITNDTVEILDTFQASPMPVAMRAHGEVHVAWKVSGFKKIKFHTHENVGFGEVDLPHREMHTTSYWFTLEEAAWRGLPCTRLEVLEGLWGLAYLLHQVAPLRLMCDVHDLGRCVGDSQGTWWYRGASDSLRGRPALVEADAGPPLIQEPGMLPPVIHAGNAQLLDGPGVFRPTVYLYDHYPGGMGFSVPLYDAHEAMLRDARDALAACPCEQGCPSCVGPVNEVGHRAKEVARLLVDRLLG